MYEFQKRQIQKECTFCKKLVTDRASRFQRARMIFCGTDCLYKWQIVWKAKFPVLHDKKWCEQQYKEKSLKKIAESIGCGETVVYKWFKRHEIVLDRRQWISGSKHYFWKNGITELARAIRTSQKYKRWRSEVLAQNKLICKLCGSLEKLEVDHIKKFKFILIDNNIQSLLEASSCSELWDVSNGRILCQKCNKIDCNINRMSSPNLQ